MKMIPLTGKITDRLFGHQEVRGFAFQLRGWEWFRMWLTPATDYGRSKWVITHWDSGNTVGYEKGVRGQSKAEVIRKLRSYLNSKGRRTVRKRLAELGWPA